ncbi:hypothetical protein [Sphaerisporangium sp. TRM90804]|uniref:Rv1733c family protein n=1 Tax=Sphaerisporangium sp. TRM90804 TaxID=3031113 RepID=UPI00244C5765|nr:hypothetical protein [Sphaerisporangium sp. TRM90804]MDH2425466.1 hypothetical protein [Sphaerisporangium sp. TRM90804]
MRAFVRWTTRCVRRYRFDRNPLRRRSDRIEAVALLATLLAVLVSVWPAVLAGQAVYRHGAAMERSDPGARHSVTAVLLEDAAGGGTAAAQGTILGVQAKARWHTPDGRERIGVVSVPADARAGSSLKMWVDSTGRAASAPRTHAQTVADSTVAAFGVFAGTAAVLFLNLAAVRWMLNRRRYAEWEQEWTSIRDRWRGPRRP